MKNKEDSKWQPVIYFGKTNLNGRKYDRDSFSPGAIKKMRETMDNKQFVGELGHPQGIGDPERGMNPGFDIVSLQNVSHIIDEVEIHSNIMFAKVRVMDTPSGRIVKDLKEAIGEGAIVFRPRAIGEVKDGVVDVHHLISFDAIPATDDAFKDEQDRYNEMMLDRIPDLPDLSEIDASFRRKNEEDSEEQ